MIHIRNLDFSYTDTPLIRNLSLDVKRGEVFSLLGPSGAGKSTLTRLMLGLLRPYEGSILTAGTEVKLAGRSFYDDIGVMNEYPSLYLKLTGEENLNFFSSLHKTERRDMEELLKRTGLWEERKRKVREYSKGMKGRLCFLIAIAHSPSLLFLDEPMSGLDPESRRIIASIIREERERGCTVIITTHDMEAAEELSDRVAFIVKGEKVLEGKTGEILDREGKGSVKYAWSENGERRTCETPLKAISGDQRLQELIKTDRLLSITSSAATLGDVFLRVTGSVLC